MRVHRALAAVGLPASVGMLAAGLATAAPPADAPPEVSPSVIMVGDSSMRGMTEAARDLIRTDYSLTFDMGPCRRLIEPSCRPVPNAVDVLRAHPGQDLVVVMTGYNDWRIGEAIDVIVNEATAHGASRVIWLTYRTDILEGAQEPISSADVFRDHNRELAERAPLHPALTVLDWDGYSAGHDDWFLEDGFHLAPPGGFALARYLVEAMDGLGLSRCAPGVAAGTPAGDLVPLPSSPSAPGRLALARTRLLDTRVGDADAAVAPLGAGRFLSISLNALAPNGTVSAFLNVAAVDPCRDGFVTVYPCGAVPLASNLNYVRRRTAANLAAVRVTPTREVCVYSSAQTDLVVDLVATVGAPGLAYDAGPPTRLHDTRTDGGGGFPEPLAVTVRGLAGVPADAQAVALNVTAVDPQADGYLIAYPCGDVPDVSTVNFTAGRDSANLAFVELSPDGTACVLSSAPTDVVVDAVGWLASGGRRFRAVTPVRRIDTRTEPSSLPTAGGVVSVAVEAPGLLNVTAVAPRASGFLTTYPCGPLPLVSTLNYRAGDVTANLAPAWPDENGEICVYLQQPGHVVVDQLGEFVE